MFQIISVVVNEVCTELRPEFINEVTNHPGSTVFFSNIGDAKQFVCLRYTYITDLFTALCCGEPAQRVTMTDASQQLSLLTNSEEKIALM